MWRVNRPSCIRRFCCNPNIANYDPLLLIYHAEMDQRRSSTTNQLRVPSTTARRVCYDTAGPTRQPRLQSTTTLASLIPPVRNNNNSGLFSEQHDSMTSATTTTTRNPYVTNRNKMSSCSIAATTIPPAATTAVNNKRSRREELASIVCGPTPRTAARRFRRDRQFGCSLEIFNGDDDDVDGLGKSSEFGSPNQNLHETMTSASSNINTEDILADGVDDDADDLLNYVAFAKRA